MADADEDAIGPGHATLDLDSGDVSDETQDFRFISSLLNKNNDQSVILKRGEKDFQSHGTRAQENVLQTSRQAMHDALSVARIHNPSSLIGYFNPEDSSCIIDEPRGNTIRNIGTNDSQNRLHLLPEECLYLVERGSLNLQYRDLDLRDIPLSLQTSYAYLIGTRGLSLERYIVYTGLKRSGYTIQRAPTFHPQDHDKVARPLPPSSRANTLPVQSLSQRLYNIVCSPTTLKKTLPHGPLVQPGLYRSYSPIYTQLSLIPFHNPTDPLNQDPDPLKHYPSLRPVYNVWKPGAPYRKTAPPPPDFRICVLDAREDDFPSLEQLDDLLQCMPYEPPPQEMAGKPYQRLRHGYRNVILAVVDQGIVSYVRIADSGFGCEPVWNRRGRGGKGGGGGRGRGRGGGRGRGR